MNKASFYLKLAAQNMRKNAQTYVPYILTCVCAVAMYYIILQLSQDPNIGATVSSVLSFGVMVMMIFAIIFLFYTNSFLMKRRKKEFGLFRVLGMERKHIGTIIFFENIYTFLISIVCGLGLGILLSKLANLILLNLLDFNIRFDFDLSAGPILSSILLFAAIFLCLLLYSLWQVGHIKPVELIRGAAAGEREPKAKWLLAILGVLLLGSGYWISVTTENPTDALALFFIAVVLVILGTYLLFTVGSIALLKILRRNKKYYYQPNHFISISGMFYRMKQNAAGLATICILSTMVLVMISFTAALYFGIDDAVNARFSEDIIMRHSIRDDADKDLVHDTVYAAIEEENVAVEKMINYRVLPILGYREGDHFTATGYYELGKNMVDLYVVPLQDYLAFSGEEFTLAENEVLVSNTESYHDAAEITVFEETFQVKAHVADFSTEAMLSTYNTLEPPIAIVVKDMDTVYRFQEAYRQSGEDLGWLFYQMSFDVNADHAAEIQLEQGISAALSSMREEHMHDEASGMYLSSRASHRQGFYEVYGSLFFLGLFLGFVFILATVLIIYYKQISEGYDDKKQYEIMQKVGLDRREAKRAINSQLLTMFFFPLIVACIHLAFAFPCLSRILYLLELQNMALFIIATLVSVLVFAVFYVIVYKVTAKVYYRIVNK